MLCTHYRCFRSFCIYRHGLCYEIEVVVIYIDIYGISRWEQEARGDTTPEGYNSRFFRTGGENVMERERLGGTETERGNETYESRCTQQTGNISDIRKTKRDQVSRLGLSRTIPRSLSVTLTCSRSISLSPSQASNETETRWEPSNIGQIKSSLIEENTLFI